MLAVWNFNSSAVLAGKWAMYNLGLFINDSKRSKSKCLNSGVVMRLFLAIFFVMNFGFFLQAESKGEIKVIYPENIQFLMEKFKDGFQKQNPEVGVILQKGSGPKQIDQLKNGTESSDIVVLSDDRLV